MKLSHVIEELTQERGLDKTLLAAIICEGIQAAYQRKYPEYPILVNYNKKTDEIDVQIERDVVAHVSDEVKEISLRKARGFSDNALVGDKILMPFDLPLGRIEIIKVKQTIAQKIRSMEAESVYQEFKSKESTIVQGVVHKTERNGVTVMVHDTLAFLPKSLMIPTERYIVGYPLRALLKEVLAEPRNENQLILDRASADFVKKLFELEIPEVFEKIVEIKKIARSAGYKTKMVVSSSDKNIDPVGTCVGVGGARIKPILRELNSEKIDILAASQTPEQFIKDALRPAEINRVEIVDAADAKVWVDEDQRSLAIGKLGQNIALASEITGINIHLVKSEQVLNLEPHDSPQGSDDLEDYE